MAGNSKLSENSRDCGERSSRSPRRATVLGPRAAFAAAVALVAVAACGPIQSGTILVDAQAELAAAQTAQGEKLAPFEYVAAEEYLHKAREKQSYADYEISVAFAKKARDCARAARYIAEARSRATMGDVEPAPGTTARCRPGPGRAHEAAPPQEEPTVHEPVDPTVPANAPPAAKPTAPAPPPKQAPPPKAKEREPEDPMPEGDTAPTPPAKAKEKEKPSKRSTTDTPPIRPKEPQPPVKSKPKDTTPEGDE